MGEIQEIDFEDFRNQNGIVFWWASELMLMLGYEDMASFRKVIDKATKAFISLGIDHYENIIYTEREENGEKIPDFKMTRFACYITAMNANPQKVEVARMQAYFAMQARAFDTINRTQLATNLFCITQAEERIKSRGIQGQQALEQTHFDVGREVRKIVMENTGKAPEQLPQEKEIPDIKKELKAGFKAMKKLDKKR